MKILQIFGVVVAVHIGVFLFIFAVPGCRSTGKQNPPAGAAGPVEPAPGFDDPYASPITSTPLSDADLNPATADYTTPIYNTPTYNTGPGAAGGNVRTAPTRPGSAPTGQAPRSQAPAATDRPAATYTVVRGDSLWKIANKHGTTVAELAAANNLSPNATLRIDQKLIVPSSDGSSSSNADVISGAQATSAAGTPYTVVSGDTLGGIARRHGVTVAAIRSANGLRSDLVRVGQTLTIPLPTSPAPSGSPASTGASNTSPSSVANSGSLTHTVMPGETLGAIALKYQVTVGDLATANNIADPTKLRAGQQIRVPGWDAPPAGSAPQAPAARTPATTRPPTNQPAPLPGTSNPRPAPRQSTEQPFTPSDSAQPASPIVPAPGEDLDAGLPPGEFPPIQRIEEEGAMRVP